MKERLARVASRIATLPAEQRLERRGAAQRRTWDDQAGRFAEVYDSLRGRDISALTTSLWEAANREVEEILLPRPPWDFLRRRAIARTMFVDARGSWLRQQLDHLETTIGTERLSELAPEDAAGAPRIAVPKYRTSHNTIHHLYHLMRFRESVGIDPHVVPRIVEWGCGYGNLAKLLWRSSNGALTYLGIDTPLFVALQWQYLTTTLGTEAVALVADEAAPIEEGKINLIPVGALERDDIAGSLFISTWALSESSAAAQDLVEERDWFGADHLLLAFQELSGDEEHPLPFAPRVGEVAKGQGASIEDIDFLSGQHYAFK